MLCSQCLLYEADVKFNINPLRKNVENLFDQAIVDKRLVMKPNRVLCCMFLFYFFLLLALTVNGLHK